MDADPEFKYQFRVVLIGDSGVGKSSLLTYFTHGQSATLKDCEPTVGVDFFTRVIEVDRANRINVKLHIWDTAGQERFRAICRNYYQNSAAAIIVFDITQYNSFEHIPEWIEEALKNVRTDCEHAVLLLVGNKADRQDERTVPILRAKQVASSNAMDYLETSAVTGQNIETLFEYIGVELFKRVNDGRIPVASDQSSDGLRRTVSSGVSGWDGVKLRKSPPRGSFSMDGSIANDESPDLLSRCCSN